MSKKKVFVAAAAVALAAGVMVLPRPAYANGGWMGGNYISKLVEFISQRFNLDKTQVQTAVDDFSKQQRALITPRPTLSPQEFQNREKTRLDNFVSQGKITTDQENDILAELEALRAKYPDKSQFQNMQNDWTVWAKANNVDPNLIRSFGMGWGIGDRGFGHGQRGN